MVQNSWFVAIRNLGTITHSARLLFLMSSQFLKGNTVKEIFGKSGLLHLILPLRLSEFFNSNTSLGTIEALEKGFLHLLPSSEGQVCYTM